MARTDSLDSILDEAFEAFADEDLERARSLVEQARRIAPQAREVMLLHIDVLDAEGEGEEAVAAAERAHQRFPQDLLIETRLATLLLDVYDDVEEARPHLESAWRRVESGEQPDFGDDEEAEEAVLEYRLELLLMLSDCRAADMDPHGALAAAEAAVQTDRDDAMARLARAAAHFDLGQLEDAEKNIAQAIDRDPRFADAYWLRGRLCTLQGDDANAARAFERAVTLEPERFAPPHRVSPQEFDALVEEALEDLPDPIQNYLQRVSIQVDDVPAVEQLQGAGLSLSPGSLGVVEGASPARSPGDDPWTHVPTQIRLFRKNLEVAAGSEEDLRDLIGTTLLHEVAHFLGLEDDDLEAHGIV